MIDLTNFGLADIDPARTVLLILLVLVGLGTVLGATERIVVFRNAGDLFATFSMVTGWVGLGFFFRHIGGNFAPRDLEIIGIVWMGALPLIAIWLFVRAYTDNGGIFSALLAVITKLPYSILVPLLVVQFVAPTGKTASQRASARAFALLFLTILVPLIYALVRDKSDFWASMRLRGVR